MTRRRIGLGILAFSAAAVLGAWRLYAAPVQLDFLSPYLERALGDPGRDLQVRIGETVLGWGSWKRPVELQLRHVELTSARQRSSVLNLPLLSIGLSGRALLRGKLAPARLELTGAELNLRRSATGQFGFQPGEAEKETGGGSSNFPNDVLRDMAGVADVPGPLHYLRLVRILGSQVTLVDEPSGAALVAAPADIELRRDRRGLVGTLNLSLVLGKSRAKIDSTLVYEKKKHTVDIALSFSGLSTDALALLTPRLGPLSQLRAILQGRLGASFDVEGSMLTAAFDLSAGPGELAARQLLPKPRKIRGLKLQGKYDGQRLDVESAEVEFGSVGTKGPELRLSGGIEMSEPLVIAAQARLSEMPVDQLRLYWPQRLAPDARAWVVENIGSGIAGASARIDLSVARGKPGSPTIRRLDGTLRYDDLDVRFLSSLPPITQVSGSATFDRSGMHFETNGGELGGLSLGKGDVEISGLDSDDERIAIRASATGPSRSVLELIPVESAALEPMGVHPAESDGAASVEANVRFPLNRTLSFDDVDTTLNGSLAGVRVSNALVEGPVSSSLQFEHREGSAGRLEASLLLKSCRFSLPFTSWDKAPGVEGHAELSLDMDGDRPQALSRLDIDAGDLRVRGSARFDGSGGQIASLRLDDFDLQETRLRDVNLVWRDGGLTAEIGSGTVDAARFLGTSGPFGEIGAGTQESGRPSLFRLSAPNLSRVSFSADRAIEKANVEIERDSTGWRVVDVAGIISGPGTAKAAEAEKRRTFDIEFRPSGDKQRLRIQTDDLGNLLRILGVSNAVRRGRLEMTGEIDPSIPGGPLRGHVEVWKCKLTDVSFLFKLITLASLRGIADLPKEHVVRLDHVAGDFVFLDRVVTSDAVRAYGPAFGLTLGGRIDLGRSALDLKGTLVPVYAANRLLGSVPVLGKLWTGDGEGLLAVDYEVHGDFRDPTVEVHPLASLTPKFVRQLFEVFEKSRKTGTTAADPPR